MVAGVFILLIKRRKRMTLNIDQESCIKCGKCVRVCPSDIFTQERAGETIGLVRVESCIVCGHCVDVCPTGSVSHSEFPPEKTHTIDYSQMPTPEQVMLLINSNTVCIFQDIDLEARPQGDAGQDRGGRSFCADGYKLPKSLVHRRHRSAKATAGERLYDRRVRLLGEAIIESRREMCGQAVYEGCL